MKAILLVFATALPFWANAGEVQSIAEPLYSAVPCLQDAWDNNVLEAWNNNCPADTAAEAQRAFDGISQATRINCGDETTLEQLADFDEALAEKIKACYP